MFNSQVPLEWAGLALCAGSICFFLSLRNWRLGLNLLVGIVFFGGIAAVRVSSGDIASSVPAIIFRDLFVVLPLYLGFFLSKPGSVALQRMPIDMALGFLILMGWLFVCAFNTADISQLVIGLKVWLFYLPFFVVGMGLASQPAAMQGFFRTILILGMITCVIGLLQYGLIQVMGYQPALAIFFGNSGAAGITLGGGDVVGTIEGIYRIPGTFSFVTQYTQFIYLYLTVAVIEANWDSDFRYRKIGQGAMFLALLAGILSGTKAAPLVYPAFVAIYGLFGLVNASIIAMMPIAAIVGIIVISFYQLDLLSFFSLSSDYATGVVQDFSGGQQMSDALSNGFFGAGIGSSTGGARYVVSGAENLTSPLGFESFFGKIAAELGSAGLFIFTIFLITIAIKVLAASLRNRSRPANSIVAPFAAYIFYNLISSIKGSVIDIDPANIFFWLGLGIIVQLDNLKVNHSATRIALRKNDRSSVRDARS
jgi:hypothetical protein